MLMDGVLPKSANRTEGPRMNVLAGIVISSLLDRAASNAAFRRF
jgi:hypothetical protein